MRVRMAAANINGIFLAKAHQARGGHVDVKISMLS